MVVEVTMSRLLVAGGWSWRFGWLSMAMADGPGVRSSFSTPDNTRYIRLSLLPSCRV